MTDAHQRCAPILPALLHGPTPTARASTHRADSMRNPATQTGWPEARRKTARPSPHLTAPVHRRAPCSHYTDLAVVLRGAAGTSAPWSFHAHRPFPRSGRPGYSHTHRHHHPAAAAASSSLGPHAITRALSLTTSSASRNTQTTTSGLPSSWMQPRAPQPRRWRQSERVSVARFPALRRASGPRMAAALPRVAVSCRGGLARRASSPAL